MFVVILTYVQCFFFVSVIIMCVMELLQILYLSFQERLSFYKEYFWKALFTRVSQELETNFMKNEI